MLHYVKTLMQVKGLQVYDIVVYVEVYVGLVYDFTPGTNDNASVSAIGI